MSKKIKFNGKLIDINEAKNLIIELSQLIANEEASDSDVENISFVTQENPVWAAQQSPCGRGIILAIRDSALGWRGFLLPWRSSGAMSAHFAHIMSETADQDAKQKTVH